MTKKNNNFYLATYEKTHRAFDELWGSIETPEKIKRPVHVVSLLKKYKDFKYEVFICIYLDDAMRVIDIEQIAAGSSTGVIVDVPRIFRNAIKNESSNIIVAHNHPGGDLRISKDDLNLTNTIKDIGILLNIPLIDHLIFAYSGFTSIFKEIDKYIQ